MVASEDRISVSAPGKVLLCGGYLICDRLNKGLVLASTSRFLSSVSWESAEGKASEKIGGLDQYEIHVRSPQFHSSYHYYFTELTSQPNPEPDERRVQWKLRPATATTPSNPLVEHTLLCCLMFVAHVLGSAAFDKLWQTPEGRARIMTATLQADNDFYSQAEHLSMRGLPQTVDGLRCLPRFMPCPQRGEEVVIQKTGLGSSAALVTSLVGALLQFFGVVDLSKSCSGEPRLGDKTYLGDGQCTVHNLAQACHALAQGKVGSGFDVSAAVYGSQIYRRFSPSVLESVLNCTTVADGQALMYRGLGPTTLHQCVLDPAWDCECAPFHLPPGLELLLGDVSGGSSTPAMVREVMKWRAFESSSKGSCTIWEALGVVNEQIQILFQLLAQEAAAHPEAYRETVSLLAIKPSSSWGEHPGEDVRATLKIEAVMFQLRTAFAEARAQLRAMGVAAGVAIEPEAQTELADATMQVPGVLCAGVPGAGGVDAIFAISLSEATAEAVMDLWSSWHERGCSNKSTSRVRPLLGGAATSVEHDLGIAGIRVEVSSLLKT